MAPSLYLVSLVFLASVQGHKEIEADVIITGGGSISSGLTADKQTAAASSSKSAAEPVVVNPPIRVARKIAGRALDVQSGLTAADLAGAAFDSHSDLLRGADVAGSLLDTQSALTTADLAGAAVDAHSGLAANAIDTRSGLLASDLLGSLTVDTQSGFAADVAGPILDTQSGLSSAEVIGSSPIDALTGFAADTVGPVFESSSALSSTADLAVVSLDSRSGSSDAAMALPTTAPTGDTLKTGGFCYARRRRYGPICRSDVITQGRRRSATVRYVIRGRRRVRMCCRAFYCAWRTRPFCRYYNIGCGTGVWRTRELPLRNNRITPAMQCAHYARPRWLYYGFTHEH